MFILGLESSKLGSLPNKTFHYLFIKRREAFSFYYCCHVVQRELETKLFQFLETKVEIH